MEAAAHGAGSVSGKSDGPSVLGPGPEGKARHATRTLSSVSHVMESSVCFQLFIHKKLQK